MRLIIDAHLDLAWNALSFNRDLTEPASNIPADGFASDAKEVVAKESPRWEFLRIDNVGQVEQLGRVPQKLAVELKTEKESVAATNGSRFRQIPMPWELMFISS